MHLCKVGDTVSLLAYVSQITKSNGGKVLLTNVTGDAISHHEWVKHSKQLSKVKKGDIITFTAIITEYIGIDKEEEQVTKKGLGRLRYVKIG